MASSHTQNHTKTLKPKETKPKPNWDTLGQPSGKFDYYVKYSAPPSSTVNVTTPSGWDIPADDNDLPHPAYQYIFIENLGCATEWKFTFSRVIGDGKRGSLYLGAAGVGGKGLVPYDTGIS
ncbi:hypothetical protein FEM48_Zijuj02G0209800 [Ziziphus jujuba var. spinosa]|uniref:Uncharacterized protein n=1 Tax=Ziziphus jujuba var. spinosa TaxID=714518 RepID=A0A978VXX4_ZIZJJ|nr:hypothetical protein FEM48_Zijuj02G0209800 [Ziziphus jujuba var. spinosa]